MQMTEKQGAAAESGHAPAVKKKKRGSRGHGRPPGPGRRSWELLQTEENDGRSRGTPPVVTTTPPRAAAAAAATSQTDQEEASEEALPQPPPARVSESPRHQRAGLLQWTLRRVRGYIRVQEQRERSRRKGGQGYRVNPDRLKRYVSGKNNRCSLLLFGAVTKAAKAHFGEAFVRNDSERFYREIGVRDWGHFFYTDVVEALQKQIEAGRIDLLHQAAEEDDERRVEVMAKAAEEIMLMSRQQEQTGEAGGGEAVGRQHGEKMAALAAELAQLVGRSAGGQLATGGGYVAAACAYLLKCSTLGFFVMTEVITAETFPTSIRISAVGLCTAVGRGGSISAPLVFEVVHSGSSSFNGFLRIVAVLMLAIGCSSRLCLARETK
eukprot:g7964.t1